MRDYVESVLFDVSLLKEAIVHVVQACRRQCSVVRRHDLFCSCYSIENVYLGIQIHSFIAIFLEIAPPTTKLSSH